MTAIDALRCGRCEAIALPPALACHRCGAPELSPVALEPHGTLHASTAIRVPLPGPDGAMPDVNPIAVVALDNGPLVLARLDPTLADARPPIGARVGLESRGGTLFAKLEAGS